MAWQSEEPGHETPYIRPADETLSRPDYLKTAEDLKDFTLCPFDCKTKGGKVCTPPTRRPEGATLAPETT